MYDYAKQKSFIFTEEGQLRFLKMRDKAKRLTDMAGVVRAEELMSDFSGDSWDTMACIDRLVEIKELIEIEQKAIAWQHRVFRAPY